MTYCSEVYDAFLSKIEADDWTRETDFELVEMDWQQLLDTAIFRFKYPRVSLDKGINEDDGKYVFYADLGQEEIQMLSIYMKHEWIKRGITTINGIKGLYTDKDFSLANLLDKLIKSEEKVALEVRRAEGIYDKSRNKRPADKFRKLAGKENIV